MGCSLLCSTIWFIGSAGRSELFGSWFSTRIFHSEPSSKVGVYEFLHLLAQPRRPATGHWLSPSILVCRCKRFDRSTSRKFSLLLWFCPTRNWILLAGTPEPAFRSCIDRCTFLFLLSFSGSYYSTSWIERLHSLRTAQKGVDVWISGTMTLARGSNSLTWSDGDHLLVRTEESSYKLTVSSPPGGCWISPKFEFQAKRVVYMLPSKAVESLES